MSKDMNAVIRMQIDLYGCIARLCENVKKSSFANITIGMVEARLEALEAYWAKFKAQHDKLVATSWEDLSGHDYLKKNLYALTEESYLSQKAMFLDVLRILKSKASMEAPAAGANLFQPPCIILPRIQLPQFSNQNIRADVVQECLAQDQRRRQTEEELETRPAQTFNENVHEDITLSVQRDSDQNEKVSTVELEEVVILAEYHAKSSSEQKKVKNKKKSSANNSNNINRKKNNGRANKKQIKALITYLEQHPNLASGKSSTSDNQEKFQNDWEKLVRYLNKFRLNGKKKDVKSWKHTWRDLKYKVSKKVEKLQKNGAIIENNLIEINLTELENKIFKIMNYKCLKDLIIVPDFPEEHNNAIKKFRAGKLESSCNYIPRNL